MGVEVDILFPPSVLDLFLASVVMQALVLLYRFFGGSLIFFFLLYVMVPTPALSVATKVGTESSNGC